MRQLYLQNFVTKLGEMIAIADEDQLYLLECADQKNLPLQIESLKKNSVNAEFLIQENDCLRVARKELDGYFRGSLQSFSVKLKMIGTQKQKQTWNASLKIPYATTISYNQLACNIENPRACRAVGSANAANKIAIIIPCHRVIRASGELGGYAGGIEHKKWLIEHERRVMGL